MDEKDFFDAYTEERFRFLPQEVDMLFDGCDVVLIPKKGIVYNAGEEVRQIYYLRKGTIKYHMIYPDGSSQTVAYSKAPSFLGIINMIPACKTVNYCTAVTPCEVSTCPIELFMLRLREYNLMEKMLRFVLGASRHSYCNLTTLLANDRTKLVDVLRNNEKFTLQETADFIGCSRVQVSRICKRIREEKE